MRDDNVPDVHVTVTITLDGFDQIWPVRAALTKWAQGHTSNDGGSPVVERILRDLGVSRDEWF